MSGYKSNLYCAECSAICKELRSAGEAISKETLRTLLSSGKTLREAHRAWVSSVIELFEDEARLAEWPDHQPRLAEARRKKAAHEATTGHSIFLALPWSK